MFLLGLTSVENSNLLVKKTLRQRYFFFLINSEADILYNTSEQLRNDCSVAFKDGTAVVFRAAKKRKIARKTSPRQAIF